MTTEEIEYAIINMVNVRQNYVIRNLSWGMHNLHECDVLKLTKSGYATEYEIKISRSDLIKDKEKKHGHESDYIKELYFVVPYYLVDFAKQNIPKRAGLIAVYYKTFNGKEVINFNDVFYQTKTLIYPEVNSNSKKWSEDDVYNLLRLSNMRVLRYAKNMAKVKWEQKNKK